MYGVNYGTYQFGSKTLRVVDISKNANYAAAWKGTGIIVDLDDIEFIYMRNSDLKWIPDYKIDGDLTSYGTWFGQIGIAIHNEERHASVTGFSSVLA